MSWWTTVSALTPVAVHDALSISGAQLLDRIGTNHITATGTLSVVNDELVYSVPGNGAAMSYSSAVSLPTDCTICALIRDTNSGPGIAVLSYTGTGGFLLDHERDYGNTWGSAKAAGGGTAFGAAAFSSSFQFLSIVKTGLDAVMYIDGVQLGVTLTDKMPPSVDRVGSGSNASYTFQTTDNLAALGIWDGAATQAELVSLEAACRAALAYTYTGSGALTLPTLAVAGTDRVTAEFLITLPRLTVSTAGGGYTDTNLPAIVAAAVGGASVAATLPHLTIAATRGEGVALPLPTLASVTYCGGTFAVSLPTLAASLSGHDATGERDAQIPLPSLTAAAVGGHYARATIPSLSAAATGTVPWIATSAATLPSLTATVDARSSAVARAEPLLPALTAQGYSGAVCSVTVGALTLAASGTTGVAGAVTATLPLFVAVATGTIGNTASADIALPSLSMATGVRAPISLPSLNLVAIGTATVAVTYEAYALNLKHTNDKTNDELTRYTNFPFDRIVRYKDSYYGMNATGLYLLEGTTDDGDPIPWEVATHITDFGSPKLKTVERAYFGGRLGPDATVTLSVGEQADNSYSYTTPRGQTVQNYRQVFGKGAKARYFSLGVSGEDAIELDSLELAVTELARRI